jgi:N-formylglutamate deformylase
MPVELFHLHRGETPLLLNFPHVGTKIPSDIAARFTTTALAVPDTDWHVHRLYDFAASLGVGTLIATNSRYVIDLNRDPDGTALYPGRENSELVPLTTFDRESIYRPGEAPDHSEVAERRERFWRPYHTALAEELDRLHRRFGFAVLWDAHSIASHLPRLFDGHLPDLNLGSAKGTSAAPRLCQRVFDSLRAAPEFSSVLDARFIGGYITRHYGRPQDKFHALQLEITWPTYMVEAPPYPYEPARAAPLKEVLKSAISCVLAWAEERG